MVVEPTNEQLEIIDNIATMLAPYFVFGYYEVEDIEQEIRLMCLDALQRFDDQHESGAKLRTFLIVHAKNRLITLKRDKLCRIFPPCLTCKEWHKQSDSCNLYNNRGNCQTFSKWSRTTTDKHNLFELGELNDNDIFYNSNIPEEIHERDLLEYIDQNIPTRYRQDYLNFLENGKMTTYAKNNIKRIIRDLAKDYVM